MKHCILTIVAFLVVAQNMLARQNSVDSLSVKDSVRAWTLNRQAHQAFDNNDTGKALFYAQGSIQELTGDLALDADNYSLLADIYKEKGSTDNAIKYYLRAIACYEKLKSTARLEVAYRKTGDYFYDLGASSKALEYYQKAYSLAKAGEDADLLISIGNCYFNMQEFQKSLETFRNTLNSLPAKEVMRRLDILSRLSDINNRLNDYNQSLKYDNEILTIYRELKDSSGISAALNNVAFDYVHLKSYPEAINAFKESMMITGKQQKGIKEEAELLINIGICYQNENDFEKALTSLRKACSLTDDNPRLLMLRSEIENIIAITYYYTNDLYNAELYSRNSIRSAQQCHKREFLETYYYTYSQILKAGNDFIKALEYYEMHLALKDSLEREQKVVEQTNTQKELNIEKTEKEMRLKLADEEMNELQLKRMKLEAEKKQKELDLLRKQSELEASEKKRILQSLIVTRQQHEAELRNREMKSLEQEKAIKELQLKQKESEQKEQEKEISLLQVEKDRQTEARKRAIYTTILTALIGILILLGLITTRRKNTVLAKQKKEIEEKNDALEDKNQEILTQTEHIVNQTKIIEEKNRSITDSIQYASRIQEAVLTPVSDIRQLFNDSFILFRPRDIVSGDFYWGLRKSGKIYVAAADCTGHGVPGAFMSMLGTTFLNELNTRQDFSDAASVLNDLRKNVIAALRQKGQEGEAQDGMDIALCIIDRNNSAIHFAGANNPLYQIHNGELNIIKGDRMPIGIHINSEAPFTDHSLKIEKGDLFYIFSDGMADQFGGPENKKLKSAAMQQLLIDVHKEPFDRQHELIEKAFDEWKGENEQVDDVLLIGFNVR
jgi:serine phosphatase RsbU (regulator of sigma subunit)/tetratricopeptide (TPR) repeat protein